MLLAMKRKEEKNQHEDKKEKQQAWTTYEYTYEMHIFRLETQTFLAQKTP